MSETKPPVLLVVDGTALAFRAFFAVRGLTDSQGRPSGALYGYLSSLLRVLDEHPAERVVVAWDRPEPTFRHRLSAEYKATRERMDEDLAAQLPWMREGTELLGLAQLDQAGFEADDILATLAAQGADAGMQVKLCAGDKDLAQVVSERVIMVPPPRRNVLFVCFAAEERGLLGSKAFCDQPPVPLDRIVANLNIEMIGRPAATSPRWCSGRRRSRRSSGCLRRRWPSGRRWSATAVTTSPACPGSGRRRPRSCWPSTAR